MDLVMPKMGGIEATRRILALKPATQVIVLTSFSEEGMAAEAIEAGARRYLLKNVAPNDLVETIRAAHP